MRLPRPYIPLRVRVQVAERQFFEDRGYAPPSYMWKQSRAKCLQSILRAVFGNVPVELHHRPALVNRLKVNIHGSHWEYDPPANDPDYLVYLPADEHDIETRVRGQGAQLSDLAIARKRKRMERKRERHERGRVSLDHNGKQRFQFSPRLSAARSKLKRKWPKRKFPKRVIDTRWRIK